MPSVVAKIRSSSARALHRLARGIDARDPAAAPQQARVPNVAPLDREGDDNRNLDLLCVFLLAADDRCIDVGANEGRFLSQMVRLAPNGHHLAFEPVPHLAAALRASFPDVDVHEAALSDTSGRTSFVEVVDDPAYSGLRERTYPVPSQTRKIEVRLERLDDVVAEEAPPRLIKIDVEGNELAVFRGGLRTLAAARPVIAFESGPGGANHYGTTPEQLYDTVFGDIGLRLFELSGAGPLSRDEYVARWHSGACWNWVARP